MTRSAKFITILIRIAVGWLFFYQGIIEILKSNWSLSESISEKGLFPHFYGSLLHSSLLPYLSYAVKGLFVIIGLLLILGLFVRIVSFIAILLILFMYFPLLHGPHIGTYYYIVDDHIVLILALLFLFIIRAGEYFGLGTLFRFSRY